MSEESELVQATEGIALEAVRDLFLEYARSLHFNLCFQSFDEELRTLPGQYAPPAGRLILCRIDGTPAGCIALKPLGNKICEMKRLFVRPEFRSKRLGLKLAEHIIREARQIGYTAMRLDTIATMQRAISLYRSLGFKEIPPYYNNPIPDAMYLELVL